MPHIDTAIPHTDAKPHTDAAASHTDKATPHSDTQTHSDVAKHHIDVVIKGGIGSGGHTDIGSGTGRHIDILPQ
jgi:hypothetical protein